MYVFSRPFMTQVPYFYAIPNQYFSFCNVAGSSGCRRLVRLLRAERGAGRDSNGGEAPSVSPSLRTTPPIRPHSACHAAFDQRKQIKRALLRFGTELIAGVVQLFSFVGSVAIWKKNSFNCNPVVKLLFYYHSLLITITYSRSFQAISRGLFLSTSIKIHKR